MQGNRSQGRLFFLTHFLICLPWLVFLKLEAKYIIRIVWILLDIQSNWKKCIGTKVQKMKDYIWFGIELVNGNDVEKKLMSFEYACNWNSLSGYVCALVAEWCLNDEISKGKAYNLDEIEGIQKIYRESSGRNKTEYS